MIRDYELYHGAIFTRLFNTAPPSLCVSAYPSKSSSSYRLQVGEKSAGIYIKYCTKRLSPWRFTFLEEHQYEILDMKVELGEVFLILVCHKDGMVTLSYDELKLILDDDYKTTEWVSVARRKRHMYTVKGRDGDLDFKVGESDFINKILNYLSATSCSLSMDKLQDNLSLHTLT